MHEPLPAHTFSEAKCYLTACEACGGGPWEIESTRPPESSRKTTLVVAHCRSCRARRTFTFLCGPEGAGEVTEDACINPTDAPSRIIDLGQWLSLFYMQAESASSQASASAARRCGRYAASCLAEALKFYRADAGELPPGSAFFTPASAEAFREHPEEFARQKLRDMQARLPALPAVARGLPSDRTTGRRKWRRRKP